MGVHHGACRPIVSDMNLPASRGDWDALRVLFWIALALLFTNSVIWPGFLDGPVSKLGDNDKDAFATLIDEVETKIFGAYPDDTHVYPGHGNDTTLGAERPHLQEWRERGW